METTHDPSPELAALDEAQKHRVIYRFLPDLRGMLFSDEALAGYFSDAIERARRKGWLDSDIASQAISGRWKKPARPE